MTIGSFIFSTLFSTVLFLGLAYLVGGFIY